MAELFDLAEIRRQSIEDLVDRSLKDPAVYYQHRLQVDARKSEIYHRNIVELQEKLTEDPDNLELLRRLAINIAELPSDNEQEYTDLTLWIADVYKRIILLNPQDSNAYAELATCYHHFKDFPKAEKCFLKAIAFDPSNTINYNGLADFYQEQERFSEAEQMYLFSLHQADNCHTKFSLADLYSRTGHLDAALTLFEDLRKELPSQIDSREDDHLKGNMKSVFLRVHQCLQGLYQKKGDFANMNKIEDELQNNPHIDPLDVKIGLLHDKIYTLD